MSYLLLQRELLIFNIQMRVIFFPLSFLNLKIAKNFFLYTKYCFPFLVCLSGR